MTIEELREAMVAANQGKTVSLPYGLHKHVQQLGGPLGTIDFIDYLASSPKATIGESEDDDE